MDRHLHLHPLIPTEIQPKLHNLQEISQNCVKGQHEYQSQDIADQVSFNITVTQIKILMPTLKKNFTSFSYSKRFSTIINNIEPD